MAINIFKKEEKNTAALVAENKTKLKKIKKR